MKVSEAKQKICPFMNGYEVIGSIAVSKPKYCICGDCMAWVNTTMQQYKEMESVNFSDKDAIDKINHIKNNGKIICYQDEWVCNLGIPIKITEDEKQGYCKRLSK